MLTLELVNDCTKEEIRISSREVAEMMGEKKHSNFLRKLEGIDKTLTSSKMSSLRYWVKSTYKDSKGEERKEYLVTRKGCELLAHKSTGEKGVLFTVKYMDKFDAMEKALAEQETMNKFNLPTTYKAALLKLVEAEEEKEKLLKDISTMNCLIAEQAPKVDIYDSFMSTENFYSVAVISKIFAIKGMGRNNLFKWLRWNKIFMDKYSAYQRYVDLGYVVHRERTYEYPRTYRKNGVKVQELVPITTIVAYFTPKGVEWLYKKLRKAGEYSAKTFDEVAEELKDVKDTVEE